MAQLELYNAPQSTCSQRVRFVLNAKGLAFMEHRLDLFAGDQLKPDYLALNPNGVVPTLLHDGAPVINSSVIMEYLEEVFSNRRRFVPAEPLARGPACARSCASSTRCRRPQSGFLRTTSLSCPTSRA